MTVFLELLPIVFKLILFFIEKTKNTPDEERRKLLAEFDNSLDYARKGDARKLSQWLGKNI